MSATFRGTNVITPLIFGRILIACIRNLGKCPCPRCLIPRYQIHNLGRPRDVARRTTAARVNSPMRRSKVSSARRLIYEKNMQINCAAVEDLLRDMSLVPTSVSSEYANCYKITKCDSRMLFLIGWVSLALTYTERFYQISCMKLNWGGGRRCLSIYLGCLNQSTKLCL